MRRSTRLVLNKSRRCVSVRCYASGARTQTQTATPQKSNSQRGSHQFTQSHSYQRIQEKEEELLKLQRELKPHVQIEGGQTLDQLNEFLSDKSSEFDVDYKLSPEQRYQRFTERKRSEVQRMAENERKKQEFMITRLDKQIREIRGKHGSFDNASFQIPDEWWEKDPQAKKARADYLESVTAFDIPRGTDPYPIY
eukprot:TRINITY_DN16381_c0_g1_i1.p1 TRINITY_DN16381_c0_g1~~TRINITY_DN16381_c0_g1_i1.p1  ORF type:complete len:195 (-),score=54.34 TRINITY_DN16381_c0_g1_i1:41-625(-)